jgi:hypothetical protein
MRKVVTHITLEPELLEKAKQIAPEGNLSMWVRMLIREAIEKAETFQLQKVPKK